MKRTFALFIIAAALFFGAVSSAAGLEIEGAFQLGNIGFTPTRDPALSTFAGGDPFWGGTLSVRQDVSPNVHVEAVLSRDLIVGNSISALFQYKTDFFKVGVGPYLGLLNSPSSILKSGISALIGAEIPGVLFLTLRTDSALDTLSADGFAQHNQIILGFSVANSALCALGLSTKEFSFIQNSLLLIDSLTEYYFDVKVFEKNVPYRLNFDFAYQTLQRQYGSGQVHTLNSIVVGLGIDLLFTRTFALTLGFRTSVYTFGSPSPDILSGVADIGFAPLLFQGSAGFRVTIPEPTVSEAQP